MKNVEKKLKLKLQKENDAFHRNKAYLTKTKASYELPEKISTQSPSGNTPQVYH